MKDDFQIPNLGQSPESYDVGFFNRFARNIEMTMQTFRSKGRGIFSDVQTDQLEVAGPATFGGTNTYAGDQTFAGNMTVSGAINVIGAGQVGGVFTGSDIQTTTLEVSGASTLHATSTTTLAATTLATSGAATLASAAITGAGTVGGSPIRTVANSAWQTVVNTAITSVASYQLTGLSAFRRLRITSWLIPDTVTDSFKFACTNNGGSSYNTTTQVYNATLIYTTSSASTVNYASAGSTIYYEMSYVNSILPTTTVDYGYSSVLDISQWNKTTHMQIINSVDWITGASIVLGGSDRGYNNQRLVNDTFKIFTTGGNLFSGHIIVEGAVG